ncbi:MAG: flavin reductase family protein [Defluviitaleaceae bacterium]|nr:flavin reductase family protein [Defluviitaleaceae bacterium]
MEKISISPDNSFCPQTLFLYGVYKDDGTPNFGLFCWFSYCWDKEMGVMACIGGEKLTKDIIRKGKVFSANLVTEALLPLADYLGNNSGYDSKKMDIPIEVEKGSVLNVPVLKDSPWVFELEVTQSIPLNDSDIFICKVRNTLMAKTLMEDEKSPMDKMRIAAPVVSCADQLYFSVNPAPIGKWGEWKGAFPHENN